MAQKTPVQTIVDPATDAGLTLYRDSAAGIPAGVNANVFITSTQENITQVTTTVNQITNTEGVAAGGQYQIQFNDQDVLAGDSGLTYNPATKVLSLTGNIVTTAIRTNNLLQANGDNWLFSYSNANTGRYLSTHTGNINGNIITGVSFSGEGPDLANITGANVTGYVPRATNANVSNRANTVVVADQPNITSVGTLANLSVYGNSFTANVNVDGTLTATFLSGNGARLSALAGSNITGVVANANYAAYSDIANTVATNAQPNITSLGTLVSLSVTSNVTAGNANLGNMATANFFFGSGNNLSNIRGPNVNGVVANANYSAYAGNIVTAAQPNITSLGTLTGVSVSKEANATGGGSTVGIAGLTTVSANFGSDDYQSPASAQGVRGRVTGSDLTKTNNFIVGVTGSYNITGTNASEFPKAGVIGAVGDQSTTADAAFVAYVDGDGGETRAGAAFKVAMINTTGNSGFDYGIDLQWLDTGVTNSTANFKVADIRLNKGVEISGNSDTMIVAGNVSADYLLGDGGLLSNLSIDSTPNANYANFANVAFHVTGSNVTGAVAYATTANAVAGSNVSGQVGNALIAGTVFTNAQPNITSVGTLSSLVMSGNITTSGASPAPILSGFSLMSAVSLTGTLTTAAQPNITSVGTLTSLSVSGNVVSGNANLGNLAQANFFSGDGRNLTNIAGASVTGTVSSATSATTAGTVTSSVQSNITSVGTLASLSVSGNATIGNISSTGNIRAGGELNVISDNEHGGSNYAGILTMTNTNTGATNPNKYIRLNPTGDLEFINSAYSATIMGLSDAGKLTATLFSGSGANLTDLPLANISGIGNIANINLNGSSSQVLYGNGIFGNVSGVGTYANADVATFLAAYGSNTLTTTGNVSVGNILATNIGNVSSINKDGNSSNVLYGNGIFAATSGGGSYANADVATFLAAYGSNTLTTTGNISVGNISATNLGNVSSIDKDGNLSNVLYGNGVFAAVPSSTYGNADVSTYLNAYGSNTITTTGNVSVGNIFATNLGNVSSIDKDGNSSNVLYGNGVFAAAGAASTGNVTFSDQVVIGTGSQDGGGSGLYLSPGTESVANFQYLRVRGGDNVAHIHLDTGNYEYFDQFFGDDNKYLKLEAGETGNVVIQTYNNGGNAWTFDSTGNITAPELGSANLGNLVTSNYFSGNGAFLTAIAGANVSGEVSYAATANAVALANVSGAGNIASIDLTGSDSNVLYGNGTFAAPAAEQGFVAIYHQVTPWSVTVGTRYFVDAGEDQVDVILPSNPSILSTGFPAIYFIDGLGFFNTNNLYIDGNGKNIMGSANYTCSTQNVSFGLMYNGVEWRIYGYSIPPA